jgi:predicted amidohydrolase
VISKADEKEAIVYADIDLTNIAETRQNIPLSTQRRFDLYPNVAASST